ncbi:hypothetical protein [Stenotrophomonas cyclobalanopsidis]|uniref:hypothetical protein n=1 Tax=Stenotrophomonas cyclobalanopsidis TaxID=2771362 RepID=UPI002FDB8A4C
MDNVTAYAALVREMEALRQAPGLLARADGPALVRVLERDEGPLELEIHVRWQDAEHTALRLEGHARGASTWNHEHLRETLVVRLQDLE